MDLYLLADERPLAITDSEALAERFYGLKPGHDIVRFVLNDLSLAGILPEGPAPEPRATTPETEPEDTDAMLVRMWEAYASWVSLAATKRADLLRITADDLRAGKNKVPWKSDDPRYKAMAAAYLGFIVAAEAVRDVFHNFFFEHRDFEYYAADLNSKMQQWETAKATLNQYQTS